MNTDDFENKIVPIVDQHPNVTLNFQRFRNCDVIQQSFYMYPVVLCIYGFAISIWFYCIFTSELSMMVCQYYLTFLIITKAFCDIASL